MFLPPLPPRRRLSLKERTHPSPVRGPIDTEKYGGKWIAIIDREIVDSDKDLERLWKRLKRKGLQDTASYMGVPPPGVLIA